MNLRHCLITCGSIVALLTSCNQREELAPYPEFLSGDCSNISNQDAFLGVPFSYQPQSPGGTPPYQWGATSLPPGLNINPDTGEISGTPSQLGSFEVIIKVTDSTGQGNVISCGQLLVKEPPQVEIACGSDILEEAVIGLPYTSTVMAAGGIEPYQWSAMGLPQNLTMNASTGQISGTVADSVAPGTYDVSITIADSSDPALMDECSTQLIVRKGIDIDTDALLMKYPDGCITEGVTLDQLIDDQIVVPIVGDDTPITCSLISGRGNGDRDFDGDANTATTFPPGIAVDSTTCELSGTISSNVRYGTYAWITTVEQSGSKTYLPYCASQDVQPGTAYEILREDSGIDKTLAPGHITLGANDTMFSYGSMVPDPKVTVTDTTNCAGSCFYTYLFTYNTLTGDASINGNPSPKFPMNGFDGFTHAIRVTEPNEMFVSSYRKRAFVVNIAFDYCIANNNVDCGNTEPDPAKKAMLVRQNGGGSNYEFGLIVLPEN